MKIPLDNAPNHAAAIGRLLGHWAILELELTDLLQVLMQVDELRAIFIYQEFVSTKAKILLIKRLNHFFMVDENLKNEIHKLLKKVEDYNSIRNDFVHAIWGEDPKNPQILVRIKSTMPKDHKKYFKPAEQFTAQKIQDVVEEIARLSQSLSDLRFQALRALTKQPQE